jgi:hypothetical protein
MSPITTQRMALLNDQECTYANGRMAAIANALTNKHALVRTHGSLALIQILSADCLLNPGAKRLTAFDIHISAVVYGATARPGQFSVSHTYKSFIAYDLVALFSSPSTFPVGSTPSIITPPAHWLSALKTLETRAAEPGRGGVEALLSIFADETAINALVRASIAMSPATTTSAFSQASFTGCAPRKSSFAIVNDRRFSIRA